MSLAEASGIRFLTRPLSRSILGLGSIKFYPHEYEDKFGAKTEDRTRDLPLTMGVLYQLSYLG